MYLSAAPLEAFRLVEGKHILHVVSVLFLMCIIPSLMGAAPTASVQHRRLSTRLQLLVSFSAAVVIHFQSHEHLYPVRYAAASVPPGQEAVEAPPTASLYAHIAFQVESLLMMVAFLLIFAGVHLTETSETRLGKRGSFNKSMQRHALWTVDQMEGALRSMLETPASRKLLIFLSINGMFMLVELSVGILTGSLGLIADACHMLFDSASLGIALYAAYMAKWSANSVFTYGYSRYEVLSGFTNGILLIFVAFYIFMESFERLFDPPEINTEHLLTVSIGGFLINVIGVLFFHEAHHHGGAPCNHQPAALDAGGCSTASDHGHTHGYGHGHSHGHSHSHGTAGAHGTPAINSNMRGVYLHILADLLGSVGVIISTVLMRLGGPGSMLMVADPVCSVIISVLILLSSGPLILDTGRLLMQQVPPWAEGSLTECLETIQNIEGVVRCEEAHFWELTTSERSLVGTVHLVLDVNASEQITLQVASRVFRSKDIVQHLTLQLRKDDDSLGTNGSAYNGGSSVPQSAVL
eukprot:NODE_906_length_1833_cov_33.915359_g799_i0.p1 GENE.NODE_906_length_1833_cov_33.915359_g799_i0~~NODE_906_length_1833_cov_33.915359_g799_i0.p1  ORF type:complete len:590 (-),score=108.72 NODE_906_length_1833_cov_33.915359_g799_i0:64-1632(-)